MPPTRDLILSEGSVFEGRYEILGELGTGSFGRVYKARQLSTGQLVAVKILRFRDDDPADAITVQTERFRRETHVCAELAHPNIVRLVDSGESGEGVLYAAFEYVPGSTLADVIAEEGALGMRETLHLMTQVLDALAAAHRRGIVHRDLKPANIMVSGTGARRNAQVLDFGLGGFQGGAGPRGLQSLTLAGEFMGTPLYASPEQLRGEPATTRSDLYAWGLILLECLVGSHALEGDKAAGILREPNQPVPIPKWLSSHRLGRLLEKVTASQVEKRDVTVEGLFRTLELAERGELRVETGQEPRELPVGERRQLTIVSCRLLVRMSAPDALDLEERDGLLRAQHEVCAELARRGDGQVASKLGDRILFHFGYPQVREDDARRAARAALETVEEIERRSAALEADRGVGLEVRIGIHTGLVITRELRGTALRGAVDVVGETPEIAADLDGLAGNGEVLVSAETERLLRGAVATERVGEQRLGGLSRAVPVYRIDRNVPSPDASQESETALVGRDAELSLLLGAWDRARAGEARTLLLSGDAGMGKSRLVRELRQRTGDGPWLECRCVPEDRSAPLRPVIDLLAAAGQPIDRLLARYQLDTPENLVLFRTLLSIADPDEALPLSRERQNELTLRAIVGLLLRMAQERPVTLAVEDLQWADPTSLELLSRLLQELKAAELAAGEPGAKLLVLLTARSEFSPPWPAAEMPVVQLPRLSRAEVEVMIEAGLAHDLPESVLDTVVSRADGVPLFVEEVTRVLVERGGPGAAAAHSAGDLEIPGTLRGLLMARLDALSPDAGETAQLASALGREFRYELLQAVSPKDDVTLRDDLSELTRAGLVFPRRSAQGERFVFKHALLRDAAYESMLRTTRQHWHGRIADALRERFPELAEQRPELLAHHSEEAGQAESAGALWRRAGDLAMTRGGYLEATHHFERALNIVQGMDPSRDRTRLELDLTESLGASLYSSRGYAAPEVEKAFARARELCEDLGDEIPLRLLYGIWAVHLTRADREATAELVPVFEGLARKHGDPTSLLTFHTVRGLRAFLMADFPAAREDMERALSWYSSEEFQSYVHEYGYDTGMYSFSYLMCSLFILGHPDEALSLRTRMLELAEKSGNPYGLAVALGFSSSLSRERGDVEETLELTGRQLAHATEQQLTLYLGPAMCNRGWALAQRGEVAEGIAQTQQGLALLHAVGVLATASFFQLALAEGQLLAGDTAGGIETVEAALASSEVLIERWQVSQLWRLKGEHLLAAGEAEQAEPCLRRALELARSQGARSYGLRAAATLARQLAGRGDRHEARSLLGGAYQGFTEGFETPDLRAARALLDELG